MGAGGRPARLGRVARGAGRDPGARPGPGPARADAGLALHLLPGRGQDHGRRPQGHPHRRPSGAAVRRRAPVELRGVRLARAAAAVRPERLRRDPAGAVRVRRQADGGQLHHRRPQQRLHQGGHQGGDAGLGAGLPGGDGQVRRDAHDGHLVRPPGRGGAAAGVRSAAKAATTKKDAKAAKRAEKTAEKGAAKARTRDSLQALSKLGEQVDGQLPDRQSAADRGPGPGAARPPTGCPPTRWSAAPRAVPRLPGHAAGRPAPAAGALRGGRRGPQGGRGGQRRHPGVHRPAARPRPAGPAVPAGQGGDRLGAGGPAAQEPLPPARRAGGAGPADDAGGQRHLPGLDQGSWRPTGTSTGASCGT